ncbi:MAG: hypothetical protein ACXWVQ_07535, partial [Methyloceanibacter sp.]
MHLRVPVAAALAAILLVLTPNVSFAQAGGPMVITPQPDPNRSYTPPDQGQYEAAPSQGQYDSGGPGQPYEPAPGGQPSMQSDGGSQSTFSPDEIKGAGHRFFGKV